jgi:uncharacterized protein (TIGR02453 family)
VSTSNTIFSPDTFRFFRELEKNNSKAWMDENRERYKQHLVEPLRRLLDALTPAAQKLHPGFSASGRTGENFSRINRDIRFANDKTPYYTHMYLYFSRAGSKGRASGQLYVGLSAKAVTVGFRIYSGDQQSAMAVVCLPRALENSTWLGRQRKRFARKYDSYWYTSEKGTWTKRSGWPSDAKEWKKAKGWIVRRKFPSSAALRPQFHREVEATFRELFPLYSFSCLPTRKS